MGTTLYNKIHLGRHSLFSSRLVQLGIALAVSAGIALLWMLVRTPY